MITGGPYDSSSKDKQESFAMQDTKRHFDQEICARVLSSVEEVRSCQLSTGAVEPSRVDYATALLKDVIDILHPYTNTFPSLNRCLQDMEEWLASGLDSSPNMAHLVSEGMFTAPAETEDIFFTVTKTLNHSDDLTLEFVWFRHWEGAPAAALREIYPNQHLIIGDIIEATTGFGDTSNAYVAFTACVAGGSDSPDKMAVFFTSKNARRGKDILQQLMERTFAPTFFAELRTATMEDLYQIVPCKAVLHEYGHTQGPLPLVDFRFLFECKTSGGLEEARVDLNGAYLLYKHIEQGEPPFSSIYRMAAQYFLAERFLRHAYAAHPSTNADAIGAQYVLGQFFAKGLLTFNAGKLDIVEEKKIIKGLEQMIDEIRRIQYQVLISSAEEAERIMREHVSTYSRALDETDTMQRSVFFLWLDQTMGQYIHW
jgi:hypothetical protein